MNKIKKMLGLVLSMAMIASTIVLPATTAQAANGDVLYEYTFEDGTNTNWVDTDKNYEIVDGSTVVDNGSALTEEGDKVAKLSAGDNRYFSGGGWGAATDVTIATLEFDYYSQNDYNYITVRPGGKNRAGFTISQAQVGTISTGGASTTKGTTGNLLPRYNWHRVAMEYNMPAGTMALYIDGNLINTETGLTTTDKVPRDFNFQVTALSGGNIFLNDIIMYEGTYGSWTKPTPAPTATPNPYIHQYTFDDESTSWSGQSVYDFADGTVAGLIKNDKVIDIKGENFLTYDNNTFFETTHATVSVDVLTTNPYNSFSIRPQTFNAANRYGAKVNGGATNAFYVFSSSGADEAPDTAVTIGTWQWYTIAIDYNASTGVCKTYVDGTLVDTYTIAEGSRPSGVPRRWGLNAIPAAGQHVYMNNFLIYEGGYKAELELERVTQAPATDAPATQAPATQAPATQAPVVGKTYFVGPFDAETSATPWTGMTTATDIIGNATTVYDWSTGSGYLNNAGWGANSSNAIATLEFDFVTTYEWNKAAIYPTAGSNRWAFGLTTDGGVLKVGLQDNYNYDSNSKAKTVAKNTWYKAAVEYNKTAGTVKLYINNELVDTKTTYPSSYTAAPLDFSRSTGISGGGVYLDNLGYYKGEFIPAEIATPAPTAVPTATPVPTPVAIYEYHFNEDTKTPWGIGEIVTGDEAGKLSGDKILKYSERSNGSTTFAGTNTWNMTTGKKITTLKFDLYVTNPWSTVCIWPQSGNNGNRPAFSIHTDGAAASDTERQTISLIDGNSPAKGETIMPVDTWVEFAVEYNLVDGKARLYMNGVVIKEIDYTNSKGSTAADLNISIVNAVVTNPGEDGELNTEDDFEDGYHPVYMDNVVFYDAAYDADLFPAPEPPKADVKAGVLAYGEEYENDGVSYVFVTTTTPAIAEMDDYDKVYVTAGDVTKWISISDAFKTSVTGAAEMGLMVMNVPVEGLETFKVEYKLKAAN